MNEYSIISLINTILNKLWLILLISLAIAALSFSYLTFFTTPTYRSSGTFIISNGGINDDATTSDTASNNNYYKSSDLSSSIQLKTTFVRILKTDVLYRRIAARMGGTVSYREIKSKVSITNDIAEDLFIDVVVTDTDKAKATQIANYFLEEGADYIKEILPSSYVKKMDDATAAYKNFPVPFKTSVLVFLACAVLLSALFAIIAKFDNTIKDEEDFKSHYRYPLLGIIPDFIMAAKEE